MTDTLIKLEAIPHRHLAAQIVDRIEHLILNEELHIGDALPPERELAAQLRVSRNILREAIHMLVQKGLVEVRQGSGTYIVRPNVDFLRDSLDFFIRFNKSAIFDLIEARRSIEVEIADLAARRATTEDRLLVGHCLDELEKSVGSIVPYVGADVRFHAALAKAGKNGIMNVHVDSHLG